MGASSSHLGMVERPSSAWKGYPPSDEAALSTAEATSRGNTDIPIAGGRYVGTGRAKGVPPEYPTAGKPPLASDNAAFASGVSAGVQAEPHPPRTRGGPELANARLTVSPSMKIPQESPVPTQGQGKVVPSTPSRQGSFGQGQAGAYSG